VLLNQLFFPGAAHERRAHAAAVKAVEFPVLGLLLLEGLGPLALEVDGVGEHEDC